MYILKGECFGAVSLAQVKALKVSISMYLYLKNYAINHFVSLGSLESRPLRRLFCSFANQYIYSYSELHATNPFNAWYSAS